MEAFFRDLGRALAEAGVAALWMLWLEDRPAAALFCLEQAGSVSLYNSGFDPDARAMSPGVVLIARTIEDAIARGFRRYDFLRGEEPYKYGFGAVPTEVLARDAGAAVTPVLSARPSVRLRVAVLSVHTCPLAALGGKETGGMNVYVREVARALGRLGFEIDVFTRSQDPAIPRWCASGRARAWSTWPPAPRDRSPGRRWPTTCHAFADGVEAFRTREGVRYDLVHSHYWLSGLAGLDLARRWDVPLVHMFHTLGAIKNAVARGSSDTEPRGAAGRPRSASRTEADRIVASNLVERADLAWHLGADLDRVAVIPCGVDVGALPAPGDCARAGAPRARRGARAPLRRPADAHQGAGDAPAGARRPPSGRPRGRAAHAARGGRREGRGGRERAPSAAGAGPRRRRRGSTSAARSPRMSCRTTTRRPTSA